MKFVYYFLFLFIHSLVFLGCTKSPPPTEQLTTEQLVQRGKTTYNLNCIACHNADPNKDGTTGPAIHGASLELLQAKILNGAYPSGHKPKRDSALMPKLPHLEKEISAIHSFLR